MDINTIHNIDCLKGMKQLQPNSVDLIVTDPPYGYSFMGKEWDSQVPSIDIWKQCLRVLKPGAFCFVMSAPRQDVQVQMIYNLHQAGFKMEFTPLYWTYASGFPKAGNIGKMVDKRGAINPDELREFKYWFKEQINNNSKTQGEINKECGFTATSYYKTDGKDYWTSAFPTEEKWIKIKKVMGFDNKWDSLLKRYDKERGYIETTGNLHIANKDKSIKFSGEQLSNKPFSPQAITLDGSYSGFQPKPAVEIILVAMKPITEKTYVDQALKNGKGITWLDDCRVPYDSENEPLARPLNNANNQVYGKYEQFGNPLEPQGRFPANLLVSNDVLNDGSNHTSGYMNCLAKNDYDKSICYGKYNPHPAFNQGDSGSFSRYFDLDKWHIKSLPKAAQKTFPFMIVPKASSGEKNDGLGYNPIDNSYKYNGKFPDSKADKEFYNKHPTVKPIKLMKYLITLGSREKDIILDPFMGSGTTAIAARKISRNFIGYEMNAEYHKIALARIKEELAQQKLGDY